MKLVLIAAVSLLASCKDKPRESPQPAPSQPAPPQAAPSQPAPNAGAGAPATAPAAGATADTSTPDICRNGLAMIEQATCGKPEARQSLLNTRKAIESTIETLGKVAGADRRQFQVMCAQMLLAIEQDAAKLSCKLVIDERQRKEITTLLDAWYGQRTPVVPTGDAAADAVIARIAAVRDAACECRDAACLDRLDQQLGEVGTMPQAAPAEARTLGSKLLEDAGRCASRVRTLAAPPR
jgi:hypothetical protein